MSNLTDIFNFDKLRKVNDYDRAMIIVVNMFKDDIKDKEGKPYINHLLKVAESLDTEEEKIVGLLHDLVEDTDATFDELKELNFSDNIIDSLKLLTKLEEESYSEYIDRIISSDNLTAIKVKVKDMEHNMDPQRLLMLNPKTKERLEEKYKLPYKKLMDRIGEIENDRYKINKRK